MSKIVVGLILAFLIGVGCRWLNLPVPAPPKITGVLLIMAITLGYLAADRWIDHRRLARSSEVERPLGDGPGGVGE